MTGKALRHAGLPALPRAIKLLGIEHHRVTQHSRLSRKQLYAKRWNNWESTEYLKEGKNRQSDYMKRAADERTPASAFKGHRVVTFMESHVTSLALFVGRVTMLRLPSPRTDAQESRLRSRQQIALGGLGTEVLQSGLCWRLGASVPPKLMTTFSLQTEGCCLTMLP